MFILWDTGKSCIVSKTFMELQQDIVRKRKRFFYKIISGSGNKTRYIKEIECAYLDGYDVKNCFLCRYHADANKWQYEENKPVFCKFLKKNCGSNEAADCQYYKPDINIFCTCQNDNFQQINLEELHMSAGMSELLTNRLSHSKEIQQRAEERKKLFVENLQRKKKESTPPQ
jgi:hypothetical protein